MIVTLLTDFGTRDHFVAAMKGVILSRNEQIQIVDITHEVPRHDIPTAAFLLASCYADFPTGTVHLAVVDPGVGSERRPIAVQSDGHLFVGPDNGVLNAPLNNDAAEARLIEASFDARAVSTTFHGRDLFAPAAAALASGVPFHQLGHRVANPLLLGTMRNRPLADGRGFEGSIIHVDHFGNCITSFRSEEIAQMEGIVAFQVGATLIQSFVPYYEASPAGEVCAVPGSAGYVELAVNGASAAERLGARRGTPVIAVRRTG